MDINFLANSEKNCQAIGLQKWNGKWQKCLIPTESCFLDGKKPNIAKLMDINFLADNEKNRQAIGFAKMER